MYPVPGVGPRPGPSQRAGGLRGRVRGRSLGGEWEPPVRQLRIRRINGTFIQHLTHVYKMELFSFNIYGL